MDTSLTSWMATLKRKNSAVVKIFVVETQRCFASFATSSQNRRSLRHEACELALQRLGCAIAPIRGDGLGRGVGKNFVFALFQTIENTLRRRLGRCLRYIEAAVHIRIDG